MKKLDRGQIISCACGCGEQFTERDAKNRPHIYVKGHANRGRIYPEGYFDYMKGNKHREGKRPWNKGKIFEQVLGDRNPAWRGGTSFERGDRFATDYQRWRNKVFERDNMTCVLCGVNNPKPIHADHIKPFKDFIDLRFDVDNGRTLCAPCHYYVTFKKKMSPSNKWGQISQIKEMA